MTMSSRMTTVVAACCLFCALVAAAIGGLGIVGVASATRSEKRVIRDELTTATLTAQFAHQIDGAYADGLTASMPVDVAVRRHTASILRNVEIPAVEATLADLKRIHQDDPSAELRDIGRLVGQWSALRTVLNSSALTSGSGAARTSLLRERYRPLAAHIVGLTVQEKRDAKRHQADTSALVRRVVDGIVVAVLLTTLLFAALAVILTRRLRRAIEPAHEQVEFSDTLQLAEDEGEAHQLLQRHLQRLVAGSTVTVLNRNNSADRLEAVTTLPDASPLVAALAHAEPRSCLAVRSARVHDEDDQRPGLLGCAVCTTCPGLSTCTPLNVGGEVIGCVLVNRSDRFRVSERRQVRDSVAQAAPVVANLRNLAIAELRAATDSLTGLPNKRAVTDTLKRMVAQASRTLSPLSLLVLDLDHFKDLNDSHGHQVGDQVLANVGAALRSALRDSDFAGRNGGEEFAVLLPETSLTGALATAEKIRASVADITIPGLQLAVSTSIGIAVYPEHAVGSERLERLADSALFVAKRSGRNRIEVAAMPEELALTEAPPPAPAPDARVGTGAE